MRHHQRLLFASIRAWLGCGPRLSSHHQAHPPQILLQAFTDLGALYKTAQVAWCGLKLSNSLQYQAFGPIIALAGFSQRTAREIANQPAINQAVH